jgi:glucokinase
VDVLQEKFSIKAELQNDANACALAEWKFGAGSGTQNMIFLTFGTGMGAGIVLNGRLYSGSCGMAGEIGHVRIAGDGPVGYGKSGSFEGFCSGGGIVQIARTKIYEKIQLGEPISFCSNIKDIDSLNAKIIGDAAEAGDPLAIEIYGICGRHLGQGLSILIDILNPEVIVIGSIFARSRELLWPSAKEVIECEALPRSAGACRIVPAKLGENIGDIAALSVAL